MKKTAALLIVCVLAAWLSSKILPLPSRAGKPQAMQTSLLQDKDLKILPVANPMGKPLVIIGTGDGGWADMDMQMSRDFNRDGVSVVGIDMLRYLWQPKTADEASRDLNHILTQYERQWHPSSITLVGFSKGAQLFPFMITRLPNAQRQLISHIVLLSPQNKVSFRVHFADWLKPYFGGRLLRKFETTTPLLPEVEKLSGAKVLCVYGAQDHKADWLCHSLDPTHFTIVEMPGKHHFDENYAALVQRILANTAT